MDNKRLYLGLVELLREAMGPVLHRSARALLSRKLGESIDVEAYFRVVDELTRRGLVERSRGQGGKIELLRDEASPEPVADEFWTEPRLMPCLKNYLERQFWRELDLPATHRLGEWLVVNTSMSGPRSGQWERPDFTVVSVTPYNVLPFPRLDVYTFELKAARAGDVKAVHQALNQGVPGNFGYFVWHAGEASPRLEPVERACKIHGIGLILIVDPQEPTSWSLRLVAERRETKPAEVDEFLCSSRFTDEVRERLRRKLRGD